MSQEPIFILWARSFWLGILPLVIAGADFLLTIGSEQTVGPVARVIEAITGIPAETGKDILRGLAVIAGLIVAHQRRGAARPYTTKPGMR